MKQTWDNQLVSAQKIILGFVKGRIFYLRDCMPDPQALWGKWFFEGVRQGTIPNVMFYGKDSYGVNLYQKV